MANYSRWDNTKNKRRAPSTELRAEAEHVLALPGSAPSDGRPVVTAVLHVALARNQATVAASASSSGVGARPRRCSALVLSTTNGCSNS